MRRLGPRSSCDEENPTLSSAATGTADVQISTDGNSVAYTLTYSGFTTNVQFAHIHLGRPATNGGTVKGTLTGAHVLATTNPPQGVAAGEFTEFVDALRAGAAYVNVHTDAFSAGEIRGQVTFTPAAAGNGNSSA